MFDPCVTIKAYFPATESRDIIHNQDKAQFEQALQHPEMLYVVVSGILQVYAQILLPTQVDGTPCPLQLTHVGQARVTVVLSCTRK
jgi:hypothetical protein